MNLCIIIPAHNEEKRIGPTLAEYYKFFINLKKTKKLNFNITIVLNACTDKTEQIIKNFAKVKPEINYLKFKQGGKGFAIIEGFKHALSNKFDLIGFVDADMSTSTEAFYDLIKNIGDYDGIIASRWLKDSVMKTRQSFLRIITSRVFNFIVRGLFLMPYRDTQCLPEFSEVLIDIDGVLKKKSIKEIEDEIKLSQIKQGADFEIYTIKNNIKIPSINKETKKIELVPITNFIIRKNKNRLLKIELEGGRTFFVSENHPLIMFKDEQFYDKPAKILKKGDLIPIVKNLDICFDLDYIDLIDIIHKESILTNNIRVCNWRNVLNITPSEISKKIGIPFEKTYLWYIRDRIPINYYLILEKNKEQREKLSLCFEKGKHEIPVRIKVNNELMRLLGYYISEGCCDIYTRHSIRFSFNKKEIKFITETNELLSKLFNIRPTIEYQNNCTIVTIYSRILCYLFKDIFKTGTNALNKRIPSFIYGLDKNKIGNFIDTYFLGDGNISPHNQANSVVIRANSSSEKLIKDLQLLLLRLGITSNVRYSKREDTIMGRKIKKLSLKWNLSIHSGSNIKKFEQFCPLTSRIYKSIFYNFKNKNPSFYERNSREIKNSDICFAGIKNIEEIAYSGKWYDFKIQSNEKPYENFMHDSGILSHNCGAKLFKNQALSKIVDKLIITKWAFDVDLLYKLRKNNARILEYPTVWIDKSDSKLNLIKVPFNMFAAVIRLRLLAWKLNFIVRFYDKFIKRISNI